MTQQTRLEFPYLAVIPYAVLSDKDLQPNAKLFYGCLVGLAKREGYCWASDKQLAEMFGVREREIHRWLSRLEEKGFIFRETENLPHKENEVFFWEKRRKIHISEAFSNKSYDTVKNDSTEHVKNDMSIEHVKNDSTNSKSINKEIKRERKAFGSHVEFSDQEYETWKEKLGEPVLTEMIQAINDHCVNNRPQGYKDYSAAMRTFLKNRKDPTPTKCTDSSNEEFSKSLISKNPTLTSRGILVLGPAYLEIQDKGANWNISFKEKGFRDQVTNQLRKWGIPFQV